MPEYTDEQMRERYADDGGLADYHDPINGWRQAVESRKEFDRWLAGVRAEAGAAALESLARGEKYLAETIGEDIDTRGRTRLLEVARRIRKHGTTAPEGEHTEPGLDPRPWSCAGGNCRSSSRSDHVAEFRPGPEFSQDPAHYPGGTR